MSPQKKWSFNPDTGGIKIPDQVKHEVEKRITGIAGKHFNGKYIRLDFRFKGRFCYIDVYQELKVSNDRPPRDCPETKQYIERFRNTPFRLCRLRYFGGDRWGFSNDKYELSVYPDGESIGKPGDAFLASAVYLQ